MSAIDLLREAASSAADTLETWRASPDMIEEVSANILAIAEGSPALTRLRAGNASLVAALKRARQSLVAAIENSSVGIEFDVNQHVVIKQIDAALSAATDGETK